MNWNSFRFIDLFAGIGGIRLGFESVGGHCVFSSEFDENACKTYEANFGEHPSGDITQIEAKDIPDFDITSIGARYLYRALDTGLTKIPIKDFLNNI